MNSLPIWAIFVASAFGIFLAIEVGYKLGCIVHRRAEDEKESPVSAISGSILGLLAFLLAFTFGIAADLYAARKALVMEEANAIGTAFLRSDFLPEPDRAEAADLFRKYLDDRVAAVRSGDVGRVREATANAARIQGRLWEMAVANARRDMNSDVAALYIDALNAMFDLHSSRVVLGMHARIPTDIWRTLGILVLLGMAGVGYQAAIAGSRRSWTMPILTASFSLVIALIASLDRPDSGRLQVSQQALENARAAMGAPTEIPAGGNQAP